MGNSLYRSVDEEEGMGSLICALKELVAAKDHIHKRAQRKVYNGEESKENIWKRTKLYSDPSDHIALWGSSRWTCFLYALSNLHAVSTSVVAGDLQIKLQPHSASSR